MPEQQFYSSTSWQAPFAVTAVTFYVTGGGGGGYRDNDGPGTNGKGGGGGSGGYLIGSVGVTPGGVYSVQVGGGGAVGYYSPGGAGGTSSFAGYQATGGGPGLDKFGGYAGSPNGNPGSNDGGGQVGGNRQGGTSLDSPYGNGGKGNNNDQNNAAPGNAGRVRIVYNYNPPVIYYFNGSTQTSSSGQPSNQINLSWNTNYANSISISEIGGVGSSGSGSYNSGLQSTAGSNSPASKTYVMTASGPGGTVYAYATVYVYNDNSPSNSWTTNFAGLEPNVTYDLPLGTLFGVDMPTICSSNGAGTLMIAGGTGGNPVTAYNGQNIALRVTTLPFNTDVSGLSSTATYGKTNSKTVGVTVGSSSFTVTVTTRAPVIKEIFDFGDVKNFYPYEDIDVIPNTPTEYLTSGQIPINDVEIPVEFKSDDPNIQINVNGTGWKNVRQK